MTNRNNSNHKHFRIACRLIGMAVLLQGCLCSSRAQTALDIARQMVPGWNLGNTLEAGPCPLISNDVNWETGWQSVKTTQQIIDYVARQGFRSVRIPCAWDIHADASHTIHAAWMERVKEVVDYCINAGLYVVLNDHWDNGWVETSFGDVSEPTVSRNCETMRKLWTQIATAFADYDNHLLFAGLNEPQAREAQQVAALKRYEQAFVQAVRQSGGHNASRFLVLQAPCTDIDLSDQYDVTEECRAAGDNRIMLEIHFYAPFAFTHCRFGGDFAEDSAQPGQWNWPAYYWGSANHVEGSQHNPVYGEETFINQQMRKLRKRYCNQGIPVIMGEFGALWRTMPTGESQQQHDASVYDWYYTVCRYAVRNGVVPMAWDTNNVSRPTMAIIDRARRSVFSTLALNGIIQGVADATWPISSSIPSIEAVPASPCHPAVNLSVLAVGKDYHGVVIENGRKHFRH